MSGVNPALRAEALARLRAAVAPLAAPLPDGSPYGRLSTLARRAAKKAVRKAIAWYVDDVARDTADRAVDNFASQLRRRDEIPIIQINHELLKGEVRSLLHTVEELGMAIAPATGLDGAATRMAELREAVHNVERGLRKMAAAGPAVSGAPPLSPAAEPPAGPPIERVAGFDYTAFERRFRGDTATILAELKDRYFELLADHAPVLDIGCGRGELLAALAADGIEARGVDNDAGMVGEAKDAGVDVECDDALAYLRRVPEKSLGAVVCIQVLEHLPFDAVLEMIDLVRTRLRPGGIFVAETPNPASLVVLGNSYILDPTHVRPLHPSLLAFLCEQASYRDVRLLFWAPAEDHRLHPIDDPAAPPWVAQLNTTLAKLNDVLFGPQDYAVVATTAP